MAVPLGLFLGLTLAEAQIGRRPPIATAQQVPPVDTLVARYESGLAGGPWAAATVLNLAFRNGCPGDSPETDELLRRLIAKPLDAARAQNEIAVFGTHYGECPDPRIEARILRILRGQVEGVDWLSRYHLIRRLSEHGDTPRLRTVYRQIALDADEFEMLRSAAGYHYAEGLVEQERVTFFVEFYESSDPPEEFLWAEARRLMETTPEPFLLGFAPAWEAHPNHPRNGIITGEIGLWFRGRTRLDPRSPGARRILEASGRILALPGDSLSVNGRISAQGLRSDITGGAGG